MKKLILETQKKIVELQAKIAKTKKPTSFYQQRNLLAKKKQLSKQKCLLDLYINNSTKSILNTL